MDGLSNRIKGLFSSREGSESTGRQHSAETQQEEQSGDGGGSVNASSPLGQVTDRILGLFSSPSSPARTGRDMDPQEDRSLWETIREEDPDTSERLVA